jgi:hypothetical protein
MSAVNNDTSIDASLAFAAFAPASGPEPAALLPATGWRRRKILHSGGTAKAAQDIRVFNELQRKTGDQRPGATKDRAAKRRKTLQPRRSATRWVPPTRLK